MRPKRIQSFEFAYVSKKEIKYTNIVLKESKVKLVRS